MRPSIEHVLPRLRRGQLHWRDTGAPARKASAARKLAGKRGGSGKMAVPAGALRKAPSYGLWSHKTFHFAMGRPCRLA